MIVDQKKVRDICELALNNISNKSINSQALKENKILRAYLSADKEIQLTNDNFYDLCAVIMLADVEFVENLKKEKQNEKATYNNYTCI